MEHVGVPETVAPDRIAEGLIRHKTGLGGGEGFHEAVFEAGEPFDHGLPIDEEDAQTAIEVDAAAGSTRHIAEEGVFLDDAARGEAKDVGANLE